jgi:hypothetical protein
MPDFIGLIGSPADLAVQLAGHDHLRKLGVMLIPATAPDFFTEDTPTAVLERGNLSPRCQGRSSNGMPP